MKIQIPTARAETLRRLGETRAAAAAALDKLHATRERAETVAAEAEAAAAEAHRAAEVAEQEAAARFLGARAGGSARDADKAAAEAGERAAAVANRARDAKAALARLPARIAEAEATLTGADAALCAEVGQAMAEAADSRLAEIAKTVDRLGDLLAELHAAARLHHAATGDGRLAGRVGFLERHWRDEGLRTWHPGEGIIRPRWLGGHADQWPARREAPAAFLAAVRTAAGLPEGWTPTPPPAPAPAPATAAPDPPRGVTITVNEEDARRIAEKDRPKPPPPGRTVLRLGRDAR